MRTILRIVRVTEIIAAFTIVIVAAYFALKWLKSRGS